MTSLRYIAIVLVIGVLASYLRCAAPQRYYDSQLNDALIELAEAQEQYFAGNGTYANDVALLDTAYYPPPSTVTLSLVRGDSLDWSATTAHRYVTTTCTITRSRPPLGGATASDPSSPTCIKGKYTQAYREYRDQDDEDDTPRYAISVPVVPASCSVESLPPRALPSMSAETMDLGYPVRTVNQLLVRGFLFDQKYDTLDTLLAAYADSARYDFRTEYWLYDAYRAFYVADTALTPRLDDWVRARPASAPARLARAHHRMQSAVLARPTGTRRPTSEQRTAVRRDLFAAARADVDTSLRLMPCNIVAYHVLMMVVGPFMADTGMSGNLMRQALAIQPNSFLLRARHMYNLVPGSGGSQAAMRRFAHESQSIADVNPRMRVLYGFVAWDEAGDLAGMGDTTAALERYAEALKFGDYWQFRLDRGRYFVHIDMSHEALEDLKRAAVQRPQYVSLLESLSDAEYEIGRNAEDLATQSHYFGEAFVHMEAAGRLDPANASVRRSLAFYRKHIPEYAPRH